MKICILIVSALLASSSFFSCNSDNNKADAVVMTNEALEDSLETSGYNPLSSTDSAVAIQEDEKLGYDGYAASGSGNSAQNRSNSSQGAAAPSVESYSAAGATNGQGSVATVSPSADKRQPRKGNRKPTVQQMLTQDARLAKTMSLNRFGNYMSRRWNMYKRYGEVSYQDKTIEIKITNEELKIETPAGKYKREADEMKLKTDAGKIKKEIRN